MTLQIEIRHLGTNENDSTSEVIERGYATNDYIKLE